MYFRGSEGFGKRTCFSWNKSEVMNLVCHIIYSFSQCIKPATHTKKKKKNFHYDFCAVPKTSELPHCLCSQFSLIQVWYKRNKPNFTYKYAYQYLKVNYRIIESTFLLCHLISCFNAFFNVLYLLPLNITKNEGEHN